MSFILDALKKSETERQRQSGPTVFEIKTVLPRNRLPGWAIGLIALLAVNLLVVAWLVLRGKPEPQAKQTTLSTPAGSAPPVNAPATSATQDSASTLASSTPAPAHVQQQAVVPAPQPGSAPTPTLDTEGISPQPNTTSSAQELNPEDYAPAVNPSAAGAASASAEGSAANTSSIAPRGSETHVTQGAASNAGVPLYEEVKRRGTNLPELRIDFHLYSPQPASRFVFLNMTKLREGENLPSGVRVESITPEGAVLSLRGTQFLLLRE